MHFVYILFSRSLGKYYIGQTSNLDHRIEYYNDQNRNKICIRRGIPWSLSAQLAVNSRAEAMRIERYLKALKNPDAAIQWVQQHPAG